MKKHWWAIGFTVLLMGFTTYISLDTFVMSKAYQTNATEMNMAMFEGLDEKKSEENGDNSDVSRQSNETKAESKITVTERKKSRSEEETTGETGNKSNKPSSDSSEKKNHANKDERNTVDRNERNKPDDSVDKSESDKPDNTVDMIESNKPDNTVDKIESDKLDNTVDEIENITSEDGIDKKKSGKSSENGNSMIKPGTKTHSKGQQKSKSETEVNDDTSDKSETDDSSKKGLKDYSGKKGSKDYSGKKGSKDNSSRNGSKDDSSKKDTTENSSDKSAVSVSDSENLDSYKDDNVSITLNEYEFENTKVYVADITLKSAAYLKTAFAKGTYGKNVTDKTSDIASDVNAILAINGDYYGAREKGIVIRNGIVYREAEGDTQILCIYADGSFRIYDSKDVNASELVEAGVWQAFSFGPSLIEDGQITVSEEDEVGRAKASNPRTAIGVIDKLHYVFVVSDGRTSESEGLSLSELASFMKTLGVTTAYNLDGGGSSSMVFKDQVINNPTTNGKTIKERSVSDIVYIG